MPILLISGYGHDLGRHRLRECGISQVIAKPVEFDDLELAIQTALAAEHMVETVG
jgi:hypothetical protein